MNSGNSSIDYQRMNRLKRKCVWWAAASVVVGVVFGILAYTPITKLLAKQFSTPRPLLTAIRSLAKQNQALASYATAILVNSELAVKCDTPNLGVPWMTNNIFTPVPTLSEFIISEDRQTVCLALYERPNNDSPKSEKNTALTEIRRQQYAATFGDVPDQAKMFRLAIVRYNLNEMDLDKVIRTNARPGLRNFYHDVPRLFPVQKDRDGLQFRELEELHYQQWLKDVRKELQQPERTTRAILGFIGSQGVVVLLICYRLIWAMYIKYHEDMRGQELPVAKFRYFVVARDVEALTEHLQEWRRQWMRAENEKRGILRRAARRSREEQRLANVVVAPNEETPERKLNRHRLKLEQWRIELLKLTPPHPAEEMAKTRAICSEAEALFDSDFDKVRNIMTHAIQDRKRLNTEQNYMPPTS